MRCPLRRNKQRQKCGNQVRRPNTTTIGVVFFAFDSRLRYGHFVWHLFVMAGTACHYFAVLGYAL